MKKTIITALLLLFIPHFLETKYTLDTKVIEIIEPCDEYKYGEVLFEAQNGYIYSLSGSEDWMVNDLARLTITDNGTTYRIDDDKVVRAIYTGYEE